MKIQITTVIIVILLFLTILRLIQPSLEKSTRIIFCNVGQGDAILIVQEYFEILVDGGPANKAVLECLNRHLPLFDRRIELIVSTHPDADHLAGIVDVLPYYQVNEMWVQGRVTKTKLFQTFISHLRQLPSLKLTSPYTGKIQLLPREGQLRVIYPFQPINSPAILLQALTEKELLDISAVHELKFGTTNNGSISTIFTLQSFSLIMTGDADSSVELALIEHHLTPQVKVIKVGHHGSKSSSDWAFLGNLQPEVAVISVGKQNAYGHPAPGLMEKLQSLPLQIYRTDLSGDVIFTIDETTGNYRVTTRE